jgi:hypothetical protein
MLKLSFSFESAFFLINSIHLAGLCVFLMRNVSAFVRPLNQWPCLLLLATYNLAIMAILPILEDKLGSRLYNASKEIALKVQTCSRVALIAMAGLFSGLILFSLNFISSMLVASASWTAAFPTLVGYIFVANWSVFLLLNSLSALRQTASSNCESDEETGLLKDVCDAGRFGLA